MTIAAQQISTVPKYFCIVQRVTKFLFMYVFLFMHVHINVCLCVLGEASSGIAG